MKNDPFGIDKGIEELLHEGKLEEIKSSDGNRYKLNEKGWASAKRLLKNKPEVRAFLFGIAFNHWLDESKEQVNQDYGWFKIAISLLKLEKKLAEDGINILEIVEGQLARQEIK